MTLDPVCDETASCERAILVSQRLLLRPVGLDDVEDMVKLAGDRRVTENTARLIYPYTRAAAEEWIASVLSSSIGTFAIALRDDPEYLVGMCGAGLAEDKRVNIGYWLGVPFWGQGYATEAVQRLVDRVFSLFSYDALFAEVRVSHSSSRRVLEKSGFQWIGAGFARIASLGGAVMPVDQFCLERRIWRGLRHWGGIQHEIS